MILADTNILIRYLRKRDMSVRPLLARPDIATCGVIRAELLQGARSSGDEAAVVRLCDRFIQLPIVEDVWPALGKHLQLLRAAGMTIPFQDAVIAATAIHHGAEIWSADKHYALTQGVIPVLRLFTPPTSPIVP